MEKTLEKNICQSLLDEVAEVRERYEADWQKNGDKYNIFKVAKIDHDEVKICSVLADLLDPHGKHWQGNRYLGFFWKTIKQKLPSQFVNLDLDSENTKVTTELVINENRRIDITLENDDIFIPIEVKIGASDLPKQLADYYAEAKERNVKKRNNDNVHVPVLYLTKFGGDPSKESIEGISEKDYVKLSFKDDIITWLEKCRENTPKTMVPVQENLRQLIAAIKSFCGISEDEKMENEIFKLVTKDDDSVRAALAICGVADFNKKALEEFKGNITKRVQDKLPHSDVVFTDRKGEDWDMIQVHIMDKNYILDVSYDWKSFEIECCIENKKERNPQIEERMAQEMKKFTNHENEKPQEKIFSIYTNRYPGLESVDEDLYFYKLAKLYTEHPQEVADKIVNIANALEGAKG